MKLKIAGGLLLLMLAVSVAGQQTEPATKDAKDDQPKPNAAGYVRPTPKERRKDFIDSVVGPYALARTVAGAGFSTWRNSPAEWGGQWEGFGRRVASNFGRNAIRQTIVYGLDESFKLDSKFYRSKKRTFGAKIKNALLSTVTARTPGGRRVFGFPRIAGTYASSIVAYEAWYPKRYDYKDGLRSGTISLGFNAVFNLFKEFIKK
ncbi:MAG: hypothetical protein JSS81_13900 [Acidobacteria bacterium]|nr:hypothetical protein [Acidobacteriota bacterium]